MMRFQPQEYNQSILRIKRYDLLPWIGLDRSEPYHVVLVMLRNQLVAGWGENVMIRLRRTHQNCQKRFPPQLRVFMLSLDFVVHVEFYIFQILFCGFSGTLLAFLTLSIHGEGLKYYCEKYIHKCVKFWNRIGFRSGKKCLYDQ